MSAVNQNENEDDLSYASGSSFRDITGNTKSKSLIPLKNIHSNVFGNSPFVIQQTEIIKKIPTLEIRNTASFSSTEEGDVFYEASPVIDDIMTSLNEPEIRFYPTLLEETNYPTINVTIEPHMTKPLAENGDLKLETLINPVDLPHDMCFRSPDINEESLALLKIMKYELKDDEDIKPKSDGWFKQWFKFEGREWSEFVVSSPSEVVADDDKQEVYLDKVYEYIYDIY
ncbi:hypothetical protein JA1_002912 [Spathaspora sp. JA1]|nr:hypothetical protein JA1_002912 [Spathaspora sp. JA1]